MHKIQQHPRDPEQLCVVLLASSRTSDLPYTAGTDAMKSVASFVPLLSSLIGTAVAAPASESAAHALVRRNYTTEYAEQLVDGTPCRAVTVIYARGTGQEGNIGESTDVGPLFLDDLAAIVGAENLAAQGVNYTADILGFEEGGDVAGSALLANLTTLVCGS